ncbi:MAG: hypothetical protein EOM37_15250 [Proteobacteria bacterium]|nr:hypothetical protein [Pseudomonadota bacterium]
MPPAGRGLAPCTPSTYLFLHTRSHQLKRSGVGRAKAMPPAGRGRAPCTPFTYFFLHTRSHQLKRSGVGRARAVGCLIEPGIVCFPAVPRTTRCSLPKLKAVKHYETREGVPADLARPATERVSREKKPPYSHYLFNMRIRKVAQYTSNTVSTTVGSIFPETYGIKHD